MNDTPRTDKVANWTHTSGLYQIITTGTVDVEFARMLEREINELKKKLSKYECSNNN